MTGCGSVDVVVSSIGTRGTRTAQKLLSTLPLQPIGSLYLLSTHSTGCVIGLILVRPDVSGLFTGGHVQQIP